MKKSFLTVIFTTILFIALAVTVFASYNTGDVNNDGNVTPADARLALRNAVGLDVFTEEQIAAADVNKSGSVDASDARVILRVAANLDSFISNEEFNSLLIEPGVLNVAVCADNPPFCYLENGTLKGVDVDVAEYLANLYDLELKLHNIAYDELVNSVKNNECDVVISRIEPGKPSNDYLAEQELYHQILKNFKLNNFIYTDSTYGSTDALKKDSSKKIGVIENSLADIIITNDATLGELSANRIVRYSRYADAYNDLMNGKIFVFVEDEK